MHRGRLWDLIRLVQDIDSGALVSLRKLKQTHPERSPCVGKSLVPETPLICQMENPVDFEILTKHSVLGESDR
jgi:hypothetical protein